MPTGSFYSGDRFNQGRESSLTGSGSSSQPKNAGNTLAGNFYGQGPSQYGPGSLAQYPTPQASSQNFHGVGPSAYGPGSLAQYPNFGALSSANQGAGGMSAAHQLANTMYGPQQLLAGQQLARQYDQLGMIPVEADYQRGILQRDNGLANQLLGIDKRGIGIEQGLTKTQMGNLGRLRAILKKQYGLAGEDFANRMDQFRIDEAGLRDNSARQLFDMRSNLTQRGAFNTVANERGTGRNARDLMYGLGAIENQRTGAGINYRGNVLGLDEKGIGYDNQAAGLGARMGQLGLDMERLGINEQQLANGLQDGLHNIGIGQMTSINALLDAIGGTNGQQSQIATTILQQILQFSGLPPDVLAQLQFALGGGAGGGTLAHNPGGRRPGPGQG